MSPEDLYQRYRKMGTTELLLSYRGKFSQDIIVGLGVFIEKSLSRASVDPRDLRRVFGIIIELSQNILHHSAEKGRLPNNDHEVGVGMLTLSEKADGYTITTENLISNAEAAFVSMMVKRLRETDEAGLKRLYKERLQQPLSTDMQTAKLGLIDIARRLNHPLEVQVSPVDDQNSFLMVSAIIGKGVRR